MIKSRLGKTLVIATALLLIFSAAVFAQKAVNKKGGVIRIASVDWPQFQPYKVRQAAEQQAAKDYGVECTLLQPTGVTVDACIETVTNAITQGYDAIIMEAWSYEPYKEVIALAHSKDIPLVSVHVPYDDPDQFIANLIIDNKGYGITAADKIAELTGGKANVLIMMNDSSISNQATQRQSFIDRCAEKWPNIKVIDTEFTKVDPVIAARVLEAALKAYPQIDMAIWLESGTVTVGATVVKEMGLQNKVKIFGIDDPPDLIASIKKGEVTGSFNQNFQREGYEAVRAIVDYFTKKPFPHITDCGIVLITKKNADNYLPDRWKPVAVKGKAYSNLK